MADNEYRPFEVIQGAWRSSPELLRLPQTLMARSPTDRGSFCKVRVSRADLIRAAAARRRQPILDFWSILARSVPPMHCREPGPETDLTGLSDANACFEGLRRPIGDDDSGGSWVAYALKPTHHYEYEFAGPVIVAVRRQVPPDVVFMAYVRLDEPSASNATKGVLTHFHFVSADPGRARCPVDAMSRYERQLW